MPAALATRDVDVLFDTRKRVSFFTQLEQDDLSFIKLLQKADKSFEIKEDQRYTAVNKDGFEVAVIRRRAKDVDPHPLKMSHHDDHCASGIRQAQAPVVIHSSETRMRCKPRWCSR